MIIKPKCGMFKGMFRHIGLSSADKVVSGVSYVTPDLWNERFEDAVDGYDMAWDVTTGNTGTVTVKSDPTDVGDPSGWKTYCLKCVTTAGQTARIEENTLANYAIHYSRFEFVVSAESLNNNEEAIIVKMKSSTDVDLYRVEIFQSGVGQLTLRTGIYYDGLVHNYDSNMSTGTRYRVEVYWNATSDLWEYKLDGVSQGNGALSSTHGVNLNVMDIGQTYTDNTLTVYFDNIGLNSSGWIGAAEP